MIERELRERLRRCEVAWRAGMSDAVIDAIALCERHQIPPPKWLCAAVRDLARRADRFAKRRRQDLIDYERYDAVVELRKRKGEAGLENTWDEHFALVSEYLSGTPAAGGPDAIEKSYKKVRRLINSDQAARYYLARLG